MPDPQLFDDLPAAPARRELPELSGSERMIAWAVDIRETLLDALYARLKERRRLAEIARAKGQDAAHVDASIAAHADAIERIEQTTTAGYFINLWTRQEGRLDVKVRTRETKRAVCDAVISGLLRTKGDPD